MNLDAYDMGLQGDRPDSAILLALSTAVNSLHRVIDGSTASKVFKDSWASFHKRWDDEWKTLDLRRADDYRKRILAWQRALVLEGLLLPSDRGFIERVFGE